MLCDLVSVIVPVYNTEKYLSACLDSILNQTYTNMQIILVNDGSTDKSGSIIDEYKKKDSRILVVHKENGGVSSARNEGIKHVKGKYIFFVDSDDTIDEQYIELLLAPLEKGGYDIVFCGYRTVYVKENKVEAHGVSVQVSGEIKGDISFFYIHDLELLIGSPCLKFYRTDIIKKNSIFYDEGLNNGEDYVFNLIYFQYIKNFYICKYEPYNYLHHERESAIEKYSAKRVSDEIHALLTQKELFNLMNVKDIDKIMAYRICGVIRLLISAMRKSKISFFLAYVDAKKIMKYFRNEFDFSDAFFFKHLIVLKFIDVNLCFLVFLYYYCKVKS